MEGFVEGYVVWRAAGEGAALGKCRSNSARSNFSRLVIRDVTHISCLNERETYPPDEEARNYQDQGSLLL